MFLVAVSIAWIPILMANQGGLLWDYLQAMQAYLAPPWVVVFILGIAWKRTTEKVNNLVFFVFQLEYLFRIPF